MGPQGPGPPNPFSNRAEQCYMWDSRGHTQNSSTVQGRNGGEVVDIDGDSCLR